MTRSKQRSRGRRRGLTVVAVLVCLIVLVLVGGALLKLGLARRGLNRDFEHRLQAEWLVESGISRALARIEAERGYKGETWSLSAPDLGLPAQAPQAIGQKTGNPAAAIVTIAVSEPKAKGRERLIRVQADFPPNGPRHLRCAQEILIDLEPKESGASR
jgi:hypothetical protein